MSLNHFISTMESIQGCREENFLCDFTIRVGETTFPVHKLVLAACSDYFRAMFSHDNVEVVKGEAIIQDVDSDAIARCVEYMYKGTTTITFETAQATIHAACLLQLNGLAKLCFDTLHCNTEVQNCFFVKELAQKYDLNDEERRTDKFIVAHFVEAIGVEEFKLLDKKDMMKYLASESLGYKDLWKALNTWMYHDVEKRGECISELLKAINLDRFPPEFIHSTVRSEILIQESTACHDIIMDSLFVHTEKVGRKNIAVVHPRTLAVNTFDPYDRSWKEIVPGNMNISNDNSATFVGIMQGLLWVLRGRKLYCMNLSDSNNLLWVKKKNGNITHYSWDSLSAVIVDDKFIFTIAEERQYQTSSRYNFLDNSWSSIPSPQSKLSQSCLVSTGGFVFKIGGQEHPVSNSGFGFSSSRTEIPKQIVEVYSLSKQNWTAGVPLLQARYGASATQFNGSIYVLGGQTNSSQYLNTVECFNRATNIWTLVTSMNRTRSSFTALVINQQLYAVGGKVGSQENTIEVFDVITGKWVILTQHDNVAMVKSGAAVVELNKPLMQQQPDSN